MNMSGSLGRPVAVHKGTFAAGMPWWYVGGVLVVSAIVCVVRQPKDLPADPIVMALVSIVGGAICLIVPIMRLRQTVTVFENGFVWNHLFGTRTISRADIAGAEMKIERTVKNGQVTGTTTKVIVTLRGGKELSIVGVNDPGQLVGLLQQSSQAPAAYLGASPGAPGWAPPSGGAPPAGGYNPPAGGWQPPR
jgi:hypothetical protein